MILRNNHLRERRYLLLVIVSCGTLYLIFNVYSGHLLIMNVKSNEILPLNTSVITKPQIIHWTKLQSNLDCYYSVQNDALPPIESKEFLKRDNSIFFHETSCRGGINSRQACAVESAARLHPNWQINLFFSAPVTEFIIKNSNLVILLQYGNVKLARLKINEYGKGTPVEDILTNQLKHSLHPIEHAADILRIVTLHKFGGVYLDTDAILVQNIEELPPNWIGKESEAQVSSGAMAFSVNGFGGNVTSAILTEIRDTFNPNSWSYNGPQAISRVLHRLCPNTQNMSKDSADCQDLKIFPPKYFYPIHYTHHQLYFQNGSIDNIERPYMHHMWNYLTKDVKIENSSPYVKLARVFCPNIYEMYGDEFGV